MRKLTSREIRILIITLGFIVFFIAYQSVIRPMRENSADINVRLHAVRSKLIKARQIVSQKDLIEGRHQSLVRLIGLADSEDAQMTAIISKIEAAARESNVHIANIQPQKAVTQKEAKFLAVELEVDGQWLDMVQFLYTLQQRPNFYFINELNLEKYSGTASSLRGRIVVSRMCLINP